MAAAAALATPALYPAFFFVLEKTAKAQETQSYQRFQRIGHTDFNTSGTNGPRSLSCVKAGTHSPSLKKSHTAAYTPKQGPSGRGRYHYPRSVPHVHKHPRAGYQNGVLCRFGILAGRCSRRTQRACGAAMRLCASLFRGVAAPPGCVIFFCSCQNCGLYTLRSELSACMR